MSQKLTRRQFMVLSGASMAALALNSCASAPPAATEVPATTTVSEPQRGGLLRIGFIESFGVLNPWYPYDYSSQNILAAIYEPLVRFENNFNIKAALAESWETSADGLTWSFKIRQGVTFHDGLPLTVEDVLYSFTELLKPDNGYPATQNLSFIDKVSAPSADTVQFILKYANLDFLVHLAEGVNSCTIVPHTKTVQELIDKPIGTGPFKLKEYISGTSAFFTRYETYWDKGLPYLDELRHFYIPEMATQTAALASGELDMMMQVNPESIAVLEKTSQLKVVEIPEAHYNPIVMSVAQKPFDDVRVRQAMKYLVNREVFVKNVLQGRGQVGNDQPLMSSMPFAAHLPPYPFDIAKAKALLAEAGYPNGFETTLVTSTSGALLLESAVVFQEMAKQAGVTVNLKQLPPDNYWTEYLTYPMAISSWAMSPAADHILSLAYHSAGFYNETGLHDKVLDGLIESARGESDKVKRQELYTQAQQRIQTEGAVIIPYYSSTFRAHHEKVQNVLYSPDKVNRAHAIWLKQS